MKDTLSYLKSVVDHPGVVSQHDGRWEWAIPLGRYAEALTQTFGVSCGWSIPVPELKNTTPIHPITHVVAVGAGKGGVGKTSVTHLIAQGLKSLGAKVGVLDADLYGPNLIDIFDMPHQVANTNQDKQLVPIMVDGIQTMSIAHLVDEHQPMMWRGPMVHKALQQMLWHTQWQPLDFLLIDLPPGNGDVWMTLCQKAPLSGAVLVSTSQRMALKDTLKAKAAYEHLSIPILSIVDNMAQFHCQHCQHEQPIFTEDDELREQLSPSFSLPLGDISSYHEALALEICVQIAALPRRKGPILPRVVVE